MGCHRALGRAYRNRQRRLGWVGRRRYAPRTAAFEGEAPGQRTTRGSLPVGRHAPAIAVLGDAEDLPHRRGRLCRLGAAEAEVVEALTNCDLVGPGERGVWPLLPPEFALEGV